MNEVSKRGRWTIRLSVQPLIRVLPGLFYLANLIRMMMITTTPYFITLYGVGVLGVLMAFFSRKYKLDNILAFILLYGLTLVINWITIGNITFSDIMVNVLLVGITLVMLINRWTYWEGIIIFYATALAVLYALNTRTVLRIFGSSNNYISVVLILAVSFYYIAVENDGRKIKLYDLLPALICFFLSVLAEGRGGILSTAVLVALMLFLYMRTVANKRARRSIIIILILFLVGVVLLIRNVDLLDTFMSLGKFGTRGANNSDRAIIWGSYFAKMRESIGYILVGAPLRDISIISLHGGNCHNSFLQLHAYNGLLMFIVFIVMLVRAFIYYWKNQQFVKVAVLAVLVLRGMTDKFIFGQYGMPIMLFFVLYPLIARKQETNERILIGGET